MVAIVSPSFGAVGLWPHRVERGTAYLESLGLRVRLMPNAARSESWVSAPAQARAEDLHQAFADDDVAVVLAGIGGNPPQHHPPPPHSHPTPGDPEGLPGPPPLNGLPPALAEPAPGSTC